MDSVQSVRSCILGIQRGTHRPIRTPPHLLELELLDALLVGCDSRTLDADLVLEDRIGGVDGDLVVRLIAVLEPQVKVLDVELEIRQDELGVELGCRRFGGEGGG
jgi:hypothetical protein